MMKEAFFLHLNEPGPASKGATTQKVSAFEKLF
jgi:hypothetical protein